MEGFIDIGWVGFVLGCWMVAFYYYYFLNYLNYFKIYNLGQNDFVLARSFEKKKLSKSKGCCFVLPKLLKRKKKLEEATA